MKRTKIIYCTLLGAVMAGSTMSFYPLFSNSTTTKTTINSQPQKNMNYRQELNFNDENLFDFIVNKLNDEALKEGKMLNVNFLINDYETQPEKYADLIELFKREYKPFSDYSFDTYGWWSNFWNKTKQAFKDFGRGVKESVVGVVTDIKDGFNFVKKIILPFGFNVDNKSFIDFLEEKLNKKVEDLLKHPEQFFDKQIANTIAEFINTTTNGAIGVEVPFISFAFVEALKAGRRIREIYSGNDPFGDKYIKVSFSKKGENRQSLFISFK